MSIFDDIEKEVQTGENAAEQASEKGSLADKLIGLALSGNSVVLFHDELKQPYVRLTSGNHQEILGVYSSAFRHWLSHSYYSKTKKAPNKNALEDAMRAIAGKALFEGERMPLHNRIAKTGHTVWYDLADEGWRAVKIDPTGWQVVETPPTLFKRHQHQAAQVAPERGGNVRDILRFVNITEEREKLLFLVLLIAYFIPGYPHPIAYVYGPQGSAKSTFSKIVRKFIDPSLLEVVCLQRKEEELVQALAHHYLLFFDNVSNIPDWISDMLCRAVTGSGFSKRQLYTNDEDIIYSLRSNIGINGIELAAGKPDLLERCVLFELPRVQDRVDETDLLTDFEHNQSKLLGAIFDAVARTLAIYPSITSQSIKPLPRMADFTKWGCAIAEAIGYTREEFLDAYRGNIGDQNDAILADHPVATAIIDFMANRDTWTDSASELLTELRKMPGADELPKAANALSTKLGILKTNLEEAGILVKRAKGKGRSITITKVPKNIVGTVNTAQSVVPDHPEKDGTSAIEWFDSLPESPAFIAPEIRPKDSKDDIDDTSTGLPF